MTKKIQEQIVVIQHDLKKYEHSYLRSQQLEQETLQLVAIVMSFFQRAWAMLPAAHALELQN